MYGPWEAKVQGQASIHVPVTRRHFLGQPSSVQTRFPAMLHSPGLQSHSSHNHGLDLLTFHTAISLLTRGSSLAMDVYNEITFLSEDFPT
jgi:hypothetical protein